MRSASTGCKKYSVIIVIGSEPITGRFIFKKTAFSHYGSSNQCLLLTGCQLSFGCRLFMLLQLLTLHWWPPSSSWKTMQMVGRAHMMMQWAGPSQLQTNNICGQDTFSLHLQQTSKKFDLPNPFKRNLLDAKFLATCATATGHDPPDFPRNLLPAPDSSSWSQDPVYLLHPPGSELPACRLG